MAGEGEEEKEDVECVCVWSDGSWFLDDQRLRIESFFGRVHSDLEVGADGRRVV